MAIDILECLDLDEILTARARLHPDQCLYRFIDGHGRVISAYTYAEFERVTRAMAAALTEILGVRRGDRVMLAYPAGLDFIVAFFGCMRAGLVAVPVPAPSAHRATIARVKAIAADSGAALGLTHSSLLASVEARCGDILSLGWIATDTLTEVDQPYDVAPPEPTLFLQYTSGSTGMPKGVIVTHRNVVANARGLGLCAEMPAAPVVVSWLPQYHDMGLIGCYFHTLVLGGSTHGMSPSAFVRRPHLWLRLVSDTGAHITAAPNTAYELLLNDKHRRDDDLAGVDLSSLVMMVNAAEPVRANTYRRFIERFSKYGLRPGAHCGAYGLAENTLFVSSFGKRILTVNKRDLQDGLVHAESARAEGNNQIVLVSSGRPLPANEVEIVDPESRDVVGQERIGEVWVAGPSCSPGYWGQPVLSEEVFDQQLLKGGARRFMRSGDLGFLHDGDLFITGRLKDLIVVNGANYYPNDIEAVIVDSFPELGRGSVVAFAEDLADREGLTVLAEVDQSEGQPDPAQIAQAVRSRHFITPNIVALVPRNSVVKTTSGKVARQPTRAAWSAGAIQPLAVFRSSELASAPASDLRAGFAELMRLYCIDATRNCTLTEAGFDSIGLVELLLEVQRVLADHGWSDVARMIDARHLAQLTVADLMSLVSLIETMPGDDDDRQQRARTLVERIGEELAAEDRAAMSADARRRPAFSEPVPCAFESGSVLLVGATGFLGPLLLHELLLQGDQPIDAMVRATDAHHGRARLETALKHAGVWTSKLARLLDERVQVVCGDLSKPDLGLNSTQWRTVAGRCRAILHNGADVNYVASYADLRRVNVEGTLELIKLASASGASMHYVSSTFIHGWTTKPLLFERDNNSEMAGLDFGYAQTKWVAEQLVRSVEPQGLSFRIYRPSLISPSAANHGSSRDIVIRLLAFMMRHQLAVDNINQVSLVPVDVMARDIVGIMLRQRPGNDALHLTAADYYTFANLTRLITEMYGYEFEYVDTKAFASELVRLATRRDPVFPLVDFIARSADHVVAMERKRYDNALYLRERALTSGAPHVPLRTTVSYLVDFMIKAKLVPAELP